MNIRLPGTGDGSPPAPLGGPHKGREAPTEVAAAPRARVIPVLPKAAPTPLGGPRHERYRRIGAHVAPGE